jgi:ADP-ribose pyrophosphatase YjhB (NUDIX family)
MFRYCPSCASTNITVENNRIVRCPDCGFVFFQNTAAAAALVLDTGESLLFVRRNKEPRAGKLDLPGGFVEPGEGAFDGIIRECLEEIGWAPPPRSLVLFASFPNIYPYKNIVYNTCDLFWALKPADVKPTIKNEIFTLQKSEVSAVEFIKYSQIDFDEIAFDSARRAVRFYLDEYRK